MKVCRKMLEIFGDVATWRSALTKGILPEEECCPEEPLYCKLKESMPIIQLPRFTHRHPTPWIRRCSRWSRWWENFDKEIWTFKTSETKVIMPRAMKLRRIHTGTVAIRTISVLKNATINRIELEECRSSRRPSGTTTPVIGFLQLDLQDSAVLPVSNDQFPRCHGSQNCPYAGNGVHPIESSDASG